MVENKALTFRETINLHLREERRDVARDVKGWVKHVSHLDLPVLGVGLVLVLLDSWWIWVYEIFDLSWVEGWLSAALPCLALILTILFLFNVL